MSPRRPNTSSVLAMTSEKEVAGQTLEERGILRSCMRVGKITVNPDTKYSVRIWLMRIEKTKATSPDKELNVGGRSFPSLAIRASRLSSTSGSPVLCSLLDECVSIGVAEEELSSTALDALVGIRVISLTAASV